MADEATFRIIAVDHTGLCVTSLDAALPFWTDVLGFELLRQGEIAAGAFLAGVVGTARHALRFALLAGHGHKVELCEYHGAPRVTVDPRKESIGAAHLCLHVSDLDAVIAAAEPHGYALAGPPQVLAQGPRAGTRVCFLSNGDSIHLELMQPPA